MKLGQKGLSQLFSEKVLIIEVFFTVNKEFFKESKRILTCKKNIAKDDERPTEDFTDSAQNYKNMDYVNQ